METISNIVAEMRENKGNPVPLAPMNAVWIAAHEREIAELEAKLVRLRQVAQTPYVAEGLEVICDADIGEMKKPNGIGVSKKETTTAENSVVGNNAKMREALENVRDGLHYGDIGAPGDCPSEMELRNERRIKDLVDSALSAPPRNCDLHDTKDKAREVFQNLRGHRVLADVSLWDDRDEIEAMFDWLFAEVKGETK